MKVNILIITRWIVLLFISSCGAVQSDDLIQVTDSLTYKDMSGTYVFKPTSYQAKRLNLATDSSITLKLSSDSTKEAYYRGIYTIQKMVLSMNVDHQQSYEGKWNLFYYNKQGLKRNTIDFAQYFSKPTDMSFEIHRNMKDSTLHILGFTSDPKFEVLRIVDFKKEE